MSWWSAALAAGLLCAAGAFGQANPPVPGAEVWLRADQGITLDANSGVSQWADQSGNGNHFEQSDANKRPRVVSNAFLLGVQQATKLDSLQGGNSTTASPLGVDFVVDESIEVTQLGTLDHLGDGFLNQITVQIWQRNDGGTPATSSDDTGTVVLEQALFTAANPGTLEGTTRWMTLAAPLALAPGAYTLVSFGYTQDYYFITGGNVGLPPTSGIRLVGTGRYGNTPGQFPEIAHGPGTAPGYYSGAGNFRFRSPGAVATVRPAVRFDGVDDGLQAVASLNLARPSTVYLAFERDNTQGGYLLQNTSGPHWFIRSDGFYSNGWVRNIDLTPGRAFAAAMVSTAAGTRAYLNGEDWTQDSNLTVGEPGRLALGGGVGLGVWPIAARVAEVLAYSRELSASERWQTERYLAERYGLFSPAANTPQITPKSGAGTGNVSVTMSVATPGAQIRYTLDGSDPTAASALYSTALSVPRGTEARARAFLAGVRSSGVAAEFYRNAAVAELPVSGPTMWLRADRAIETDANGRVARWNDLTGNGNHVEQGFGSQRPTVRPDAFRVGEEVALRTSDHAGNAAWGGTVGEAFVVEQAVEVTALGAFDHLKDGFAGVVTVQLWSRDDHATNATQIDDTAVSLLAEAQFTAADPGTLDGVERFKTLSTPLLLNPGSYMIMAWGYTGADLYREDNAGTTATTGRGVRFVGTSQYDPNPGVFPTSNDTLLDHNGTANFKYRFPGAGSVARPAVSFDGLDDGLWGVPSMSHARPSTVCVVFERDRDEPGYLLQNSGENGWWFIRNDGFYSNGWIRNANFPVASPTVAVMESRVDGSRAFVNDAEWTLDPNPATGTPGRLALGGGNGLSSDPLPVRIAEVIVYDRALTVSERWQLNKHLADRYSLYNQEVLPPVISPPGGIGTGNVNVTMTDNTPGAEIRYTLDGSVPTASSPLYSTALSVPRGTRVRARGFGAGALPGGTSEEYYADAATVELPVADPAMWLKAESGLEVDSQGGVSRWRDLSGHGNHVEQIVPNQRPGWEPAGIVSGEEAAVLAQVIDGSNVWGGTLGNDFVVEQAVEVTSLGAFDHLRDGFSGTITAQIWTRHDNGTPNNPADDTAGSLVAAMDFTPAAPGVLDGQMRFKPLASPLTLSPGNYTMFGWGYTGGNLYREGAYSTVSTGKGIRFTNVSRYGPSGSPGAFPNTQFAALAHYNGSANFKFRQPGATVASRPSVRFDGVDDGMWGVPAMNLGRPSTVFVVLQGQSGDFGYFLQNSSGGHWFVRSDGLYANGWIRYRTISPLRTHVIEMNNRSDGTDGFVDGEDWTLDASLASANPGRLALGGGNGLGIDPISTRIAEIVVYDRVLSPAERWSVRSHLAGRYGSPAPSVPIPVISPDSNVGTGPVDVTISSTTPGAAIRYTLDGSQPTPSSPLFSAPFSVARGTEVRARAFLGAAPPSLIATQFYENALTTDLPVAGASLWLRADHGIVTDSNGKVARWLDLSGSGSAMTQEFAEKRPSQVESAIGGAERRAFVVPSTQGGNSAWGGSLGADFNLTSPIELTHLGAFDHLADGFTGTITVDFWKRDDNATPGNQNDDTGIEVIASRSFTAAQPGGLEGTVRFLPLATPLLLQPGAYSVVSRGWTGPDLYVNGPTGEVTQSFGVSVFGGARWDSNPGAFPLNLVGGQPLYYAGSGNFKFQRPGDTSVPKPAVRFDGLDDGLLGPDNLTLSRPSTIIATFQQLDGVRGRLIQSRQGSNWLLGMHGSPQGYYAEGWVTQQAIPAFEPITSTALQDVNDSFYFSNSIDLTQNSAPIGNPVSLALGGGEGTYYQPGNSDLAELIVYDRLLDPGERQQVEKYLASRYGQSLVPLTPPLVSPDGGLFAAGLSVTASHPVPGTQVRYTTDGSAPTVASPVFPAALSVSSDTVLKVAAFGTGYAPSAVRESQFVIDPAAPIIPQRPAMQLWLRAGVGVETDADGVSRWRDLSGSGHHAVPESAPGHPALIPAGMAGQPSVQFDGVDDYLRLANGFKDFTQGMTAIFVARPGTVGAWQRFLDLGRGAAVDNIYFTRSYSTDNFAFGNFVGGSQQTQLTGANGFLGATNQLVSVTQESDGTASVFVNGSLFDRITAYPLPRNVLRNSNYIGRSNWWWSDALYSGQLGEVLLFNRALTNLERETLEASVRNRYGISTSAVTSPTFSPAPGLYTGTTQVTISTLTAGSQIRYTTDGSEPNETSTLYNGPLTLNATTRLRARAFEPSLNPSQITQATYLIGLPPSSGDGLLATYFDNEDFTGSSLTRVDPAINFAWGFGSPDPAIGVDFFSVRWTGKIVPRFTENFTFFTQNDDGVRLWIDLDRSGTFEDPTELLIDDWTPHGEIERATPAVALQEGLMYEVKLEYFEYNSVATARLLWQSAVSEPKAVIPQSQLFSNAAFSETVATPSISPAAGSFNLPVEVTLASATPGATIRYSLDGNDPDQSSTLYTAPFMVGASATVKARAYKVNFNPSGVASALFNIDASPPTITALSWDGAPLTGNEQLLRAGILSAAATDNQGILRAEFSYQPVGNPGRIAIGNDTNPADGLASPWDVSLISDGSYTLWVRVFDTAGSFSELSRQVTVSLAAPPAPSIVSPASGTSVETAVVTLQLQAPAGSNLRLFRNGAQILSAYPPANGLVSYQAPLVVGSNDFHATSVNRAGSSAESNHVLVERVREFPQLTLSFPSPTIVEGTPMQGTVSIPASEAAGLTVTISVNQPSQIENVAPVVIPAGATAANFQLIPRQDTVIEIPTVIRVEASAPLYRTGTRNLDLLDDDIPVITIVLDQSSVSESAGTVTGRVIRNPASDREVTVHLTNTKPSEATAPASVTIPAGQSEVPIALAVIDDTVNDGNQIVTLRGEVRVGGVVVSTSQPVNLEVRDNEGPYFTITLDPTFLLEGTSGLVRVRRGGLSIANPLALTLSDTPGDQLTLPASANFAANQAEIVFPIAALNLPAISGTRRLAVRASAPAFSDGVAILTVSDELKPELTVDTIATPSRALTEEYMDIAYTVHNFGPVPATGPMLERVYLSSDPSPGNDTLIRQVQFGGELAAGGSFRRNMTVLAPREAGTQWLIVTVDAGGTVDEISEDNNTVVGPDPIVIAPAYNATVQTASTVIPANTPITMTGSATRDNGQPAPFSLVNIHLKVNGTTRIIAALTNSLGQFSTVWTPLAGEGGQYTIGAVHPGVSTAPVQDNFTILTLGVDLPGGTISLDEGQTVVVEATLRNPNSQALNGIALVASGLPSGLTVLPQLPSTSLVAGASMTVPIQISAANGFSGSGTVPITATTAEGISLVGTISIRASLLIPALTVDPGLINISVLRGTQKTFSFTVTNTGGLATGPMQVLLPNLPWLRQVSANPVPSILPGQSAAVSLLLSPDLTVPLTQFDGQLVLRPANGSDKAVPYRLRVVSSLQGDLDVEVVDELFYFTAAAPKVQGATVRLRDAISSIEIAAVETGSNGVASFPNLTEGWYRIEITAPEHEPFTGNYLIEAGQLNTRRLFISKELVTYSWTVQEIEIEDRYRVSVEATFETNVPVPVVTVEPSVLDVEDLRGLGQTKVINVTVTNHGWISAEGAKFDIGTHPFYEITPLVKNVGTVPAKSSLVIPFVIRRIGVFDENGDIVTLDPAAPAQAPGEGGQPERPPLKGGSPAVPCSLKALLQYYYLCGPQNVDKSAPMAVSGVQGNCGGIGTGTGIGGGGTGGGFGPGSGGAGGGNIFPGGGAVSFSSPNPCLDLCIARTTLDCLIGYIPGVGCAWGWVNCAGSSYAGGSIDWWTCLTAIPGCLGGPITNTVICALNYIKCYIDNPTPPGGGLAPGQAPIWEEVMDAQTRAFAPELAGAMEKMDKLLDVTLALLGTRERVVALKDPGPQQWFDKLLLLGANSSEDGNVLSAAELVELETLATALGLDWNDLSLMTARWNRSFQYYAQSIFTAADVPAGGSTDFIQQDVMQEAVTAAVAVLNESQAKGFVDPFDEFINRYGKVREALEGGQGGTCSQVKIRIDQDVVMTRTAFRATLELENKKSSVPLTMVGFNLQVRDAQGQPAEDLFNIAVTRLTGLAAIDGTGEIGPLAKGASQWTLIPRDTAAQTEVKQYTVGGVIHFEQGGVVFDIPVEKVSITVRPDAALSLKYFHQRSVYSDDPHTDQIEPSIPYKLAVMVENTGAGEARKLSIISGQPQIVDNEKGLLIDFKIIATQVDGEPLSPSLTANFGNVAPGQRKIATWLLTSSLHGLFVDYKATFEHTTGLGDPRLSLLQNVEIHEMIQMIRAQGAKDDGKPDFLVNDVQDVNDYPDTVHLSDGTTALVTVLETATVGGAVSNANLSVTLSAAAGAGWWYIRVPDPADGQFRLVQVRRSDGRILPLDENAWVTDRTFIGGGRRPIYENILHLADCDSTGSYTLTYERLPDADITPPASSVTMLPGQSSVTIPLVWSGADDTGVSSYDIFVSINNGPWTPWLERTRETAAVYQGVLGDTYSFYSISRDAAGNAESKPPAVEATTEVTDLNLAPVIGAVGNQQIEEGLTFSLQIAANDQDGPRSDLRFSVSSNASGLVIDPLTGVLRWVTGETDGGIIANVTVIVTDQGTPVRSSQVSFTVEVVDTNLPPQMAPFAPRQILVGELLQLVAFATDPDVPVQTVRYSLGDAPAGMTIQPASGVLTFSPTAAQAGQNFVVRVIATDDGTPVSSVTNELLVIVPPLPEPPLARNDSVRTIVDTSVTLSRLLANDLDPQGDPLVLESVDALSERGGAVTRTGALVTYKPPLGFIGTDRFHYRVRNTAQLTSEATVTVRVVALEDFRLTIDSIVFHPDRTVELTVFDTPARTFGVDLSTDLLVWHPYGEATPDERGIMVFQDLLTAGAPTRYYRFTSDSRLVTMRLESVRLLNGKVRLQYRDAPTGPVPFESSANLRDWFFLGNFTADGSGLLLVEDPVVAPQRFYRPQ